MLIAENEQARPTHVSRRAFLRKFRGVCKNVLLPTGKIFIFFTQFVHIDMLSLGCDKLENVSTCIHLSEVDQLMTHSASHEKRIWFLAHQDQPDPSVLKNLTAGGYQLNTVAIRKNASMYPPKGIDLALMDLAAATQYAMTGIMRLREDYKGPLAVLDEHPNERRHILALEIGADDYLEKTVSSPVLTARIEALIRRHQQQDQAAGAVIDLGELVVDAARREVTQAGKSIPLTTVEFKLLWHLASHAGAVVSRNDIHQALYNRDYNGIDRSVDMYISRVRKKLGDDSANPKCLKTIRGDGYLLVSA